mmetsp:Transcript_19433/g.29870  ORF Transcript_19433/g.29870 Transcript_19433/m.29870 type:complete len:184 (-) Transcript_19433:209-760(-)|eukprot:CAMPEP_0170502730 /NCGR_PEP_ID=MMETSP0208-20121228/42411_1 /TAXON_ID=197538 /ORGANISM="Strombidium inclinatum, Strain S3" /LENGTH=183 /DNA_ID=CAMNT_0010781987 /DNA_START=738 /DNA_END=1289 /DNA_ORIENTATION=-
MSVDISLKEEERSHQVCECPQGFYGLHCNHVLGVKCFVNLTEPAVYDTSHCEGKDPDYLYSIPGFEPCFFFNFSKAYDFKFKLECRHLTSEGIVPLEQGYEIGAPYKDIVREVCSSNHVQAVPRSIKNKKVTVTLDFQDWKWFSNFKRFSVDVTDPAVIAGEKEGSIHVDFSKLEQADAAGDS